MSDNIAIFKYAIQPGTQLAMSILMKKTFKKIADLTCEYAYDDEPLYYADREKLTFSPLKKDEKWVKNLFGCALMHFTGVVPKAGKGQHIVLLLDIGGEACVLDKGGKLIAGITDIAPIEKNFHILRGKKIVEITPCAQGGEEIDVWLEAGDNDFGIAGHGTLHKAEICVYRQDIGDLFYDIQNQALTKPYFPFYTAKHLSINASLLRSYPAVFHSSEKSVARSRRILAEERKKGTPSPYTVYAVGHGHLDLAFMWPIRETKRKEVRTFINQLNNFERYDGYVYGASQPQQFEWLESLSPELFDRLKEAEKKGELEIQGGFWVETDTNLPSGESLIRQAVYGQKYWKEKFGHISKICWLPDTFGFSGNLPQILKKSGMDYFMTIKLSWGDTNRVTRHTFRWAGIDGTEVITHIPPEHTYSGEAMPINTLPAQKEYAEKEKIPVWGSLFGMGDGGAGPSIGHIESYLRQQQSAVLPTVKFSPLVNMFEEMEKYRDKMDRVQGELYLEAHRGTYTTQSDIKKNNALCEIALHNAEFLISLSGGYDKKRMDEIWKEVLLYQFHDILPGTSVERVYKECFPRQDAIRKELLSMCQKSLDTFSGEKLVAYNCNPFGGKFILEREGKAYQTELIPYGGNDVIPYKENSQLSGGEDYLQNGILTVRFDGTGDIVSMVREGKEYINGYACRLKLFNDITQKFDAWEVDYGYLSAPSQLVSFGKPVVKVSATSICHEVTGKVSMSTVTRRVILREGSPLVEVEVDVDWKEEHKMLRAENYLKEWADEALCHIQMGNIKRSASEKTVTDKAKFEICAQQWLDIGGISFFGKAKYGWRAKNNIVSLNLLRAPTGPDPTCDRRPHTLMFAYLLHEGSPFESGTPACSYLYNNPPFIRENACPIPSFATINKRNIILETVKPSEDGKGIVLRLYEGEGVPQVATITLQKQPKRATETNLLEDYIGEIDLNNVEFKPYEIKTIYLEY